MSFFKKTLGGKAGLVQTY